MANIFDRLQFVKHEEIFATREDAYNYVINKQIFERPSLVAEPMILLYESDDAVKGPNVILAIGSVGNGVDSSTDNRTFFIDTQKTEEEIEELRELIEQAIKSLTIIPVDSETLDLSAEKTDEGTFLSGDVKIADYTIASGKVQNNIITVEEGKGLYAFVDMDYDPETFVITFNVNGVIKNFQLPPDQHVEKGWYSPADEALFLKLADGSKVKIDVVKLIDEWTVLSSASTTPIMLFKEHVSAFTEEHDGVYDWQDLLTADVRLADHISDNIIHKDRTGRFLYVKGTADNIKYKNNQTVAQALDSIDTRVSTSAGNMIYRRPDGLFASAMLDYNSAENKLIYRYTDTQTEDFKEVSFTLNSVKILQDITYDPVKEVIVIRYIDAQGEYQRVEIPAKDIIEEWIVNNEAHNIELVKYRSEGQGKDILSADAKIHAGDNNILEDKDHKLYVNGISDNIKYDVTGDTTVKGVLDDLSGKTIATDVKLDAEIDRAKAAEKELEDTIGSGFTSDPHDNVTYKFEALSAKVDSEIERSTTKDDELEAAIAAEQARAEAEEEELKGRVDAIDDEIDNLQNEIDAVSADSASSLKDIINEDKSIEIDKTNPTKPVISVNISEHEGNTIRLIQQEGSEGLFNFVDLTYDEVHNKLIFTRSTSGTTDFTREIELRDIDVIKDIYYDPDKDVLVIIYKKGEGEGRIEIPLAGLIDEWDVYNDVHSAVELTKTWNSGLTKNILSAEVRISEKEDNILENQEGELYVSSSAITANAAAIQAEIERATAAEGQLADDIAAEETRAEAAEQALSGAIDSEASRATNAETALQTNIDNEVSRAEGAERDLQATIDTETTRAISAETALHTAITNEATRATAEETRIEHLIQDEASNRTREDGILLEKINTEAGRAASAETRIETALNNEISRAQRKENELNDAITAETLRAQAADNELYQKVSDETAARISGDSALDAKIAIETARAIVAENSIQESLNAEIERSTAKDESLEAAIAAETAAREAADDDLEQMILDATLKFSPSKDEFTSNGTIEFNNYETHNNIVEANVILQGNDDNIIKVGSGIYATVHMSYDIATNKLKLTTSAGSEEFQLAGATVIDNLYYDNESGEIVITYHDGSGNVQTMKFPASELFNEWIVQNPSEKSAVELTKTRATEQGQPDELKARVLITDDRDGDGKPDEGSDNMIEIRNNGLYVCGSGFTLAECVSGKTDAIYKSLFGDATVPGGCGEGIGYAPDPLSCVLSGATSFMDADRRMATQICEILEMWVSGETCTSISNWVDEGANKKMMVDVKVSRGNTGTMSDDEIIIENLDGDYIDPTRTEFTDTNALRIVCLQEGAGGVKPSVDTPQNGMYLSNVWDCGLYYDEETDTDAIAAAQAAGYKTDNYRTDTNPDASNYNYMNNVRQSDIPHE